MANDDAEWRAFLERAVSTLVDFQANKIGMKEAFSFFKAHGSLIGDDDAARIIEDTVSEIDGFPRYYDEFVAFLRTYPSRSALVNWLKS